MGSPRPLTRSGELRGASDCSRGIHGHRREIVHVSDDVTLDTHSCVQSFKVYAVMNESESVTEAWSTRAWSHSSSQANYPFHAHLGHKGDQGCIKPQLSRDVAKAEVPPGSPVPPNGDQRQEPLKCCASIRVSISRPRR